MCIVTILDSPYDRLWSGFFNLHPALWLARVSCSLPAPLFDRATNGNGGESAPTEGRCPGSWFRASERPSEIVALSSRPSRPSRGRPASRIADQPETSSSLTLAERDPLPTTLASLHME